MNGDDRFEGRIARLISASRATANPAVLARARARIEAQESPAPAIARWLGRPAVLAGSCALFVLSTVASVAWLRADAAGTSEVSIVSSLLGDDGTYGLPGTVTNAPAATSADSGEVSL